MQAQETPKVRYWEVVTKDSLTYKGQIVDENEEILKLETLKSKIVIIQQVDILYKRLIDIEKKEIALADPLATYYLVRPNALPLRKGEGFYRNTWLLLNKVRVGVTDRLSVSGTTFIVPYFDEGLILPTWFSIDYSIPVSSSKFHIGPSLTLAPIGGRGLAVLPTLQGTYGDRDFNISLGYNYLGILFFEDDSDGHLFTLGTSIRVTRKQYFIFDNLFFYFPEESGWTGISFLVYRFSGAVAVDIGFIASINNYGIIGDAVLAPIPWLSLSVPFGRKMK